MYLGIFNTFYMAALVPGMFGGSRHLPDSEFEIAAFSLVSRTLGFGSITFKKIYKRVLREGVCSQVLVTLIPMLGQFGQITPPLGVNLCIIMRSR